MEAKEAITAVRDAVNQPGVKEKGQVSIPALLNFLDAVEKGIGPSLEARRIEWEKALADAKAANESNLAQFNARSLHTVEMFKSVMEAGREALNALLLINGGAVVAILGFLGTAMSKDSFPASLGLALTTPLAAFGSGVLLGAVSHGGRYFSQWFYTDDWNKAGHTFTALSILFGLSGYVAFAIGLAGAYHAFHSLFSV